MTKDNMTPALGEHWCKKPVEIEAIQFDGKFSTAREIRAFTNGDRP